MNGTVYTLEAVKTVFMDLFCTPKSSKGVNGHCGSTSRTCIVEDYSEDEYAQWTIDEVTGEQGYIDDERSCCWRWDDNECSVAPIIISDRINSWPLCQNRKARKLSEFNYWRGAQTGNIGAGATMEIRLTATPQAWNESRAGYC